MLKRSVLALATLVALFFCPVLASETNQNLLPSTCNSIYEWFVHPLPPALVDALCTIYDGGGPQTIELSDGLTFVSTDVEGYPSNIQESELPEETKQQILLLLAIWSQG